MRPLCKTGENEQSFRRESYTVRIHRNTHPPCPGAQRLAASQGRHIGLAGAGASSAVVCSTPCGITEVGTRPRRRPRSTVADVLNALRHHGVGTSATAAWRLGRDRVCSTPCGITGGRHPARRPVDAASAIVCSTPCGITGGRHQRRQGDSRLAASCAQRLAASQRSAHGTSSGARPQQSRAQRLAASRSSALELRSADSHWPARVLNALRHHGGRHRARRYGPSAMPHVCSTPCGITEFGTHRDRTASPPARRVLNALRHHWVGTASSRRLIVSRGSVLNALRHH